jgi:acetate kinase
MQQLLAGDDPRAAEAFDLYGFTLVNQTGAMVAVLEGDDAERTANAAGQSRISTAGSRVPVRVIPTDEEPAIARHSLRLLDLVCG